MLTYWYKKSSTLPRRQFIVTAQVWWLDGSSDFVQYEVEAPDVLMAYEVVRRHLDYDLMLNRFRLTAIREVVMTYVSGQWSKVPTVVVRMDDDGWHN